MPGDAQQEVLGNRRICQELEGNAQKCVEMQGTTRGKQGMQGIARKCKEKQETLWGCCGAAVGLLQGDLCFPQVLVLLLAAPAAPVALLLL